MKVFVRAAMAGFVTIFFAVGSIGFALSEAKAESTQTPPVEGQALLKWLQAGKYKSWAHESAPHQSAGPHPVQVIAYLNSALEESLAGKAASHPKGAAAVKELLDADGKLSGWAVSIKTANDSNVGKGWFWYEILGTTANDRVVAADNGVGLCFGCHLPGKDFVLIPHPLK